MNKDQIKHMTQRFLMWRLPENFSPDAGISFKATFNDHMDPPMRHNPIGTNLFSADQAEEMVRHMIEGLPPSELEKLISSESIEAIADDIAPATGNCHPEVTSSRRSAMIRMGERLRQPFDLDLTRAERKIETPAYDISKARGELQIITLHTDKILDEVPMVMRHHNIMRDIKRRCADADEALGAGK